MFERSSVFSSSSWILQENLWSGFTHAYDINLGPSVLSSLKLNLSTPFLILRDFINFRQFLCLMMLPQVLIQVSIFILILSISKRGFTRFISTRRAVYRAKIRRLHIISLHSFRRLLIDGSCSQDTGDWLRLESEFYRRFSALFN